LDDERSDRNKLVISEPVDGTMSTVAAATLASPKYQAGKTIALADLSTESGLGVVLPAGNWVCLGLVLSTASGNKNNNRVQEEELHLFKLELSYG
jgi:hypothetical protein